MRFALIVMIIASILLLITLEKTGYVLRDNNKEFTIFAEKWEFVPDEIKVRKGDNIKINLLTSEQENFSFKLSRYMYNDVAVIEPNKTSVYKFTAHTPGTFTYRCENPCGFGKNLMIGKLTVEPY